MRVPRHRRLYLGVFRCTMSHLAASTEFEAFQSTNKFGFLPANTDIPPYPLKQSDAYRSTHPSNVQRRSTEPKNSGRAEDQNSFKFRWIRTGPGSRTSNSQKAQKPSILRCIHKRGNRESSDPAQGRSRRSTMDTKNSLSFEQTRPWDQKAILSLGEQPSHDLVVA